MMVSKKYVKDMNTYQHKIYTYLKKKVTDNGSNFKDILVELEEGFEYVPDRIYTAYWGLTNIQRIEVIYFFTKYMMKKKPRHQR